jgi:uncharacterized damage-inducible protein DinB
METLESPKTTAKINVVTSDILLQQWLGHRRLTCRAIEAFPEDKLFNYSIGGMRTFAQLVTEMLVLGAPGIRGIVEGTWPGFTETEESFKPTSKQELLKLWDDATEEIKTLWPKISAQRFQETDKFFGQYEDVVYRSVLYVMDNDIHHRAQGYVYLRSLGIEPPAFWNRG